MPRDLRARVGLALLSLLIAPAALAQQPGDFAALARCEDDNCMRRIVPLDSRAPVPPEACAPLAGKVKDDTSLEMLCHLVLARNRATTRAIAPCPAPQEPDANPDYDTEVDRGALSNLVQKAYLRQVYAELLKRKPVAELGRRWGGGGGTRHGSLVADAQLSTEDGKWGRFSTYYCIAEAPRRYVPYFYALVSEGLLVEHGFVERLSLLSEKVLAQVPPDLEFMAGGEELVLADVDRSGQKDVVVISREGFKGYEVATCLHDAKGTTCRPSPAVLLEENPTWKDAVLSADAQGRVLVTLTQRDEPYGRAIFRWKRGALVLEKKEGRLAKKK